MSTMPDVSTAGGHLTGELPALLKAWQAGGRAKPKRPQPVRLDAPRTVRMSRGLGRGRMGGGPPERSFGQGGEPPDEGSGTRPTSRMCEGAGSWRRRGPLVTRAIGRSRRARALRWHGHALQRWTSLRRGRCPNGRSWKADRHPSWHVDLRCLVGFAQGSGRCGHRRLDKPLCGADGEQVSSSSCRDLRDHIDGVAPDRDRSRRDALQDSAVAADGHPCWDIDPRCRRRHQSASRPPLCVNAW